MAFVESSASGLNRKEQLWTEKDIETTQLASLFVNSAQSPVQSTSANIVKNFIIFPD